MCYCSQYRRIWYTSKLCPICEQNTKTKHHIFQCRSSTTTNARDITMGAICGFLRSNSHPFIARQIERILNQFHRNYNISLNPIQPTDSELEQNIQKATNTLIKNGMDTFFNDLTPTSRIDCQHKYFKFQSSKPPEIRIWTQSLIELFHSHAINLLKKQSKILHENTSRSHEKYIPDEAYKTLLALRADPIKLPTSLRHLTKRTRRYFRKTNI